jgi:hypothetical protein
MSSNIRIVRGIPALRRLYLSQLTAKDEIIVVRAHPSIIYDQHFGDWWGSYIEKRKTKGILTRIITPDDASAIHNESLDTARKILRTWVHSFDYNAPVEFTVWNNHAAITIFEKQPYAITISQPALVQALKSLILLAETGAKSLPVRHEHSWSLAH